MPSTIRGLLLSLNVNLSLQATPRWPAEPDANCKTGARLARAPDLQSRRVPPREPLRTSHRRPETWTAMSRSRTLCHQWTPTSRSIMTPTTISEVPSCSPAMTAGIAIGTITLAMIWSLEAPIAEAIRLYPSSIACTPIAVFSAIGKKPSRTPKTIFELRADAKPSHQYRVDDHERNGDHG